VNPTTARAKTAVRVRRENDFVAIRKPLP